MAKSNKISGAILCVIFLVALVMALKFPERSSYFPILICGLGLLTSIILVVLTIVSEKKGTSEELEPLSPKARKTILIIGTLIVLYAIGISVLGFAVSTFIYMVANGIILCPEKISKENKRPLAIILISALVVSVSITVAFRLFLYVPLPSGILI